MRGGMRSLSAVDIYLSLPGRTGLFLSIRLLYLLYTTTFYQLRMKVSIKEWNAVATWRWNMPDDEVCGICRVQFDGTCPTCKFPGDDCSLCKCWGR